MNVAREVARDVKNIGLADGVVADGQKCWPGVNPYYYQIKQGFYLRCDDSDLSALCTPWGEFKLYGGSINNNIGTLALMQLFLKRVKGLFEKVGYSKREGTLFHIFKDIDPAQAKAAFDSTEQDCKKQWKRIKNYLKTIQKKISYEEAETLKGKEVIIYNTYCGYSAYYKLTCVDNVVLPEAVLYDDIKDARSYESINFIWKIMEDMYQNDPSISNEESRLFNEYVTQVKISKNHSANYKDYRTVACSKCLKKGCKISCIFCSYDDALKAQYCSKRCQIDDWKSHYLQKHQQDIGLGHLMESQLVDNCKDIPLICIKYLKLLIQQPWFDGRGSLRDKGKVLPLLDRNDCRLLEHFLENIVDKKSHKKLHITKFGFGNYQLYTKSDEHIPHGIELWVYDDTLEHIPLDIDSCYKDCCKVIKKIRGGWKPAKLINNPQILHKESEEEWLLFTKEKSLPDETGIITTIAAKCGVRDYINCDDAWCKPKGDFEHSNKLYLWINKKHFDDVQKVFDFVIMDNSWCLLL